MNVRGFLSRALIALSIALGAAGASQAQPTRNWVPAAADTTAVSLEITTEAVSQVASTTFWQRFVAKSSWSRFATRVGTMCVAGAVGAIAWDSATQHTTSFIKGMRVLTGCGAGVVAGALFELVQTTLLGAGASTLVGLAGGLFVAALTTVSIVKGVELVWQAHTLGNGMATVSGDGRTATIPRRRLNYVDEEYIDHTQQTKYATNLRHPQARSTNGSNLNGGKTAGNQWVGGYQIRLQGGGGGGCPSNPAQC